MRCLSSKCNQTTTTTTANRQRYAAVNMRPIAVIALIAFGLLLAVDGLVEGRAAPPGNGNNFRRRPASRRFQYLPAARAPEAQRKCGYEGCPATKPGMLNVHLVPHTHDDVGWLKTVDQYYYGTRARITKVSVQNILDSVVESLLADAQRRFIYVESAFFFKWWRDQSDERQRQVHELVQQGRLEFIGGAWSMNDEACVHYQSTVDQFTWGLRRLNDTFGECGRPRIGWQIDPFGHSREQASLFAQMGYDGLFIGRLDYQDKVVRLVERRPEMIWRASANLRPGEADLFTGVLYNNYGPPPGFCFDVLCNDEPIVDAKRSRENNVERRVNEFIEYARKQSEFYRTDNVIMTMGGDFTYTDAQLYFKNMDKLISYANQRQSNGSMVNLFYSTPSCYLKSLHDADISWTTKQDDFFPYASDPHAYWTGYFSSRPALKRFERQGNHFLQVCKQLSVLAPHKTSRSFDFHLNFLRETMGVLQHHDAVTGTEQQHVADDYARLLTIALRACGETVRNVLNQLTTGKPPKADDDRPHADEAASTHPWPHYDFAFDTCRSANISQCTISEQSPRFMVTIYNPLAHASFQYVRIPVPDATYAVRDYRNVAVQAQAVPIPGAVRSIAYRRSAAAQELVFLAADLPPLGYKSYFVSRSEPEVVLMQSDEPHTTLVDSEPPSVQSASAPFTIGNKHIQLHFTAAGQLDAIEANGARASLKQTFFYYAAAIGNNEIFTNRSSGAYIFRPNASAVEHALSAAPTYKVIRNELAEEVQQTFGPWLSQVVRVYRDEQHAEFEWLVGGIPIDDGVGKEIVMRFSSDLRTAGEFYTDSNGREMLKRRRNRRDSWNVTVAEPVAGNYYPVTARMAIEDAERRLAILNDRAQGGSSLADGAVELMLHRRLLHDDAFGVGEALNETAYGEGLIVRGKHWLVFGSKTHAQPAIEAQERFVQAKHLLPGWVFVSDATNLTYGDWREQYTNIYSGVSLSLPQNVHLLSLEPWRDGTVLARFEHLLERNEDPAAYSKPVTFNLQDVLPGLRITELRETTLAANQWLADARRLQFNAINDTATTSEELGYEAVPPNAGDRYVIGGRLADNSADPFDITLQPMQIRTFVLTLEESL